MFEHCHEQNNLLISHMESYNTILSFIM